MKAPVFNVEISGDLVAHLRSLPDVEAFLDALELREYRKIVGTSTHEELLAIKHRILFIGEMRNFYKSLLTSP